MFPFARFLVLGSIILALKLVPAGAKPGDVLWVYTNTNAISGDLFPFPPVLAPNGTIYLVSGPFLDAVNPAGTLIWRYTQPSDASGAAVLAAPTVRPDGTILLPVVGGSEAGLYALNPTNSAVLWKQPGEVYNVSAGQRANYFVQNSSADVGAAELRAVDLQGHALWSAPISPSPYPSVQYVAIAPDGTLYTQSGTVSYAHSSGGALLRSRQLSEIGGNVLVGDDSTIYQLDYRGSEGNADVFDPDGTFLRRMPAISAIQPSGDLFAGTTERVDPPSDLRPIRTSYTSYRPNGTVLWSKILPLTLSSGQAIGVDGTIYSLEETNSSWQISALNPDGTSKWSKGLSSLSDVNLSSPTIGPDGTIYVSFETIVASTPAQTFLGTAMLAIAGEGPLAVAGWPVAGRDAQNTRSKELSFFIKSLSTTSTPGSTVFPGEVRTLGLTVHATLELGESANALRSVATVDVFRVPEHQNIEVALTNLQPAHIYFYRFIATSGTNLIQTPIGTFNTPGPTANIPVTEVALRSALLTGGTITFATNGVIQLANELQIKRDAIIDAGAFTVTIDGAFSNRLFSIHDAQATLRGLTLANAKAQGANGTAALKNVTNGGTIFGGGIYASNATLRVESCTISNCVAVGGEGHFNFTHPVFTASSGDAFGGGIYLESGSLSVRSSSFSRCTAIAGSGGVVDFAYEPGHDAGGAVFVANGTAEFQDSLFADNIAPTTRGPRGGGTPGLGGAIGLTNTRAEMTRTHFLRNSASSGGAVYTDSVLGIESCAFDQNQAVALIDLTGGTTAQGGALCSIATNGMHLSNTSFTRNLAQGRAAVVGGILYPAGDAMGGAVFALSADLTLTNCVIALNQANGGNGLQFTGIAGGRAVGGGIFCSNAMVAYSTIASNTLGSNNIALIGSAVDSAAIFCTNGVLTLHSTILENAGSNISGTVLDRGYNLVSDSNPQFTNLTTRINIDARLGPLEIYDGAFGFMVPLADSPAIDAGDPTSFPATDLRQVGRPRGAGPEIGAIETSATENLPVTEAALRTALLSGGLITFRSDGAIQLTGELQIQRDTVIDAGNFNITIDGASSNRLFLIHDAQVTLRGLTLADAKIQGAKGTAAAFNKGTNGETVFGGGIYASNATLRVESCTISNCVAVGGEGDFAQLIFTASSGDAFGGGIYLESGSLSVRSSSFSRCTAIGGSGGVVTSYEPGHDMGGAVFVANGTAEFQDSLFADNIAPTKAGRFTVNPGLGGAIALTNTPADMTRTHFSRNTASSGGAIYTDSGLGIESCTFDQNQAVGLSHRTGGTTAQGGALCSIATNGMHLSNSSFTRNFAQGGKASISGVAFPAGNAMGGAVFALSADLTLTNCVIALNQANGGEGLYIDRFPGGRPAGGGIFCSNAMVAYSTIASNTLGSNNIVLTGSAVDSAAIFGTNGVLTLHSTILENAGSNISGTILDRGYNLSSDSNPQFTNSTTRTNIDAQLGPFQIPDGFYGFLVPLADSPAIDAGDPTNFPRKDVGGWTRPVGNGPDIGAMEVMPLPTLAIAHAGTNLQLDATVFFAGTLVIQGSNDLVYWSSVAQSLPGEYSFTLEIPNDQRMQFYRVWEFPIE